MNTPITQAEQAKVDRLIREQEGETFDDLREQAERANGPQGVRDALDKVSKPSPMKADYDAWKAGLLLFGGHVPQPGPIARAPVSGIDYSDEPVIEPKSCEQLSREFIDSVNRALGASTPPSDALPYWTRDADPLRFTLPDEPSWHPKRHDDLDTRKAVAVVGAFLLGIAVGLLAMRAALDWGGLS